MRHVHAVSRGLSDRRVPRTARVGCDEMCVLPDDRVPRIDSGRAASRRRQPHLRLRHLPGSLPVERISGEHRRSGVVVAAGSEPRRLDRSVAPDRRGAGRVHRGHGDDARRREGPAKKSCGRTRQLRRSRRARRPGSTRETGGTFSDPLVLEHVRWAKRKLAGFYRPRTFVMTYSSTVPRRSRFELMARRAGIR